MATKQEQGRNQEAGFDCVFQRTVKRFAWSLNKFHGCIPIFPEFTQGMILPTVNGEHTETTPQVAPKAEDRKVNKTVPACFEVSEEWYMVLDSRAHRSILWCSQHIYIYSGIGNVWCRPDSSDLQHMVFLNWSRAINLLFKLRYGCT